MDDISDFGDFFAAENPQRLFLGLLRDFFPAQNFPKPGNRRV